MDLIYGLTTLAVGFVFSSAGGSKLVDRSARPPEQLGEPWKRLLGWTATIPFALAEYSVGLTLPLVPEGAIKTIELSLLSAVGLLGLAVQAKLQGASCHCFGSITPKEGRAALLMHLALTAATIFLVLYGTVYHPSTSGSLQGLLGSTFVAIASIWLIAATTSKASSKMPSPAPLRKVDATKPAPIAPDFLLGETLSGERTDMGKIAKQDTPVFIVGVHSACKACKKLLPDLVGFARGFGHQLPIVVIANEPGYVDVEDVPVTTLIDGEEALAKHFGLDGRPFAVLINGSTLQPVASPSQGDNAIRMLFAVMLNARITPTT